MAAPVGQPRLPISEVLSKPGQLVNTFHRRQRTVVGTTNRDHHRSRSNNGTLNNTAASEKEKSIANHERIVNAALAATLPDTTLTAVIPARPLDAAATLPVRVEPRVHLDKDVQGNTRGQGLHVYAHARRGVAQREAEESENEQSMRTPTLPILPKRALRRSVPHPPDVGPFLQPVTRLGRTVFPDTRDIIQPDPSSAHFGGAEQRTRPDPNHKIIIGDDRGVKAARQELRAHKRREHEERIRQTYVREEQSRALASENRALNYTYQRLKYLERVAEVERHRAGVPSENHVRVQGAGHISSLTLHHTPSVTVR